MSDTEAPVTYESLIAGATEAARASRIGYGLFTLGRFQMYAFPVTARTRQRREHYRFTHYLAAKPNGTFYRTNRERFMAELAREEDRIAAKDAAAYSDPRNQGISILS